MKFIVTNSASRISIANDCIYLSNRTNAKQRLAVSYAIAQSGILKVLETRIESRMDEYECIPAQLARGQPLNLSSRALGRMIGEVLMVRHEVNLYSDLLDIPDFFWEEEKYSAEFDLASNYFEMDVRIDILNKRLALLKQLIRVVNVQLISMRGKTRMEIIIWAIFVYLCLEAVSPVLVGYLI